MKVICEKAKTCRFHREDKAICHGCGGAEPHEECLECGNCPVDPKAKCIPVDEKDGNK